MTGATPCTTNIATPGSHQDTHAGGFWEINDAYLVKFDSAGVRQWGTYFGDTSDDWAFAVCTDEEGNAYITGDTRSEQGISTPGSHQQVFGGYSDGLLAKFSGQGNLVWATYYGGADEDDGYGVDCKGSTLYMGGLSMSTTGIATTGAYQTTMAGWQDAFLARFDTSGVRQWGTYYGGPEWESNGYGSNNISCDNNLNCYLSTLSRSESGIVLPGAHQPKYGGDFQDLAIAKFDPNG
ncbi:MAG TPA: SBBP repeat-containing protein, partial [Flavipsychrobacter sp.]|nr:SBBP repeat-containing protein [Flavipsychrobacter sp.]